jgi:hypothetical protein
MKEIGNDAHNWGINKNGGIKLPQEGPDSAKIGFINEKGEIYQNGNCFIGTVTIDGAILDQDGRPIALVEIEGKIKRDKNSEDIIGHIDPQGNVLNARGEQRGTVDTALRSKLDEKIPLYIRAAAGVFVLLFKNWEP